MAMVLAGGCVTKKAHVAAVDALQLELSDVRAELEEAADAQAELRASLSDHQRQATGAQRLAAETEARLQAEVDTADRSRHQALRDLAKGRLAEILDWQRTLGVPVLPLTASEETLPQLRRLMGLGPA